MDAEQLYKVVGVVLYLGCLLGIGVAASKRMHDVKDYFAAGKSMGFLAVAFSARATGESAWLLLGLTGMGAAVGVRGFWVVLGEVIGVTGAWLLLSRRFKRLTDEYESITVPDYLESRFRDQSQNLRKVAAASLLVFVTVYVAAQIHATGTAFQDFLGWNYYVAALLGFAVVMVYSASGGMVAVVWSDVFQGTLMFAGLVGLPLVAIYGYAGGFSSMMTQLAVIDPKLVVWSGPEGWTLLVILQTLALALIGLGFLGSPQVFVRFIALRSEDEISKGAFVAFAWTILADSGAVLIGMVGRVLLTEPGSVVGAGPGQVLGSGGEDVLPDLVAFALPAFLVGLMIAIVLSAIMSTADSLLVLASSALVRDWYQKVQNPHVRDDELVDLSRKATYGIGVVAFAVAMLAALWSAWPADGLSSPDFAADIWAGPTNTVFWFVIFGWSGISATFCPTMILSLFWRKMTANGAFAAMLTGFLCVPLFKFLVPLLPVVGPYIGALEELPPAFAMSFLAGIVVSLADRAGQERLADIELA